MLERPNALPSTATASLPLILTLLLTACGGPLATVGDDGARPADTRAPTTQAERGATGETARTAAVAAAEPHVPTAPPPPVDVWERLRRGFALERADREEVLRETEWYARHQAYFDRVGERARYYLHHVAEQVEARGMPAEIALLPVVESAFQPFAYSPARASGIWQFMPATGRLYGLKQNWWYDGRRDVVAATAAALDYLQKLNEDFEGDWTLAIAAYNAGEGNVMKAIRKNLRAGLPTDFWSLDLPGETRRYLPRLLAVTELVREPQAYGLVLPAVPDAPYFSVLDTGGQIDLAIAADMAGVTLEELYLLNPGFNRWATDPDGPHRLVVPVGRRDAFAARLAELPASERITWRRHAIRSGETLIAIAARYHTSVATLQRLNGLKGSRIRIGDSLVVPAASQPPETYALSADARARDRAKPPPAGQALDYVVQSGDSLWDIASRHRVSVRALAGWNGLRRGDVIRPGQSLVIWRSEKRLPAGSTPVTARADASLTGETTRKLRYTVRRGDSLWEIARRFKVSVAALRRWNGLAPRTLLQPGQALLVYVDVTGSAESI